MGKRLYKAKLATRALLEGTALVVGAARVLLASRPSWFGYIRYVTPLIHTDDHRSLTRQAIDALAREGMVESDSPLAARRRLVEASSGMLDLAEMAAHDRPTAGRPRRESSHMYDPVARIGIDDARYVNALEDFTDYWERARVYAKAGPEERAMVMLGYCSHLLQDMAVPAHTHCAPHGLENRTADNLELQSRARSFRVRMGEAAPRGEKAAHLAIFGEMALESRGLEGSGVENEIAGVLRKYYEPPRREGGLWKGSYIGDPYRPVRRPIPSSPRISLVDLITLRNHLMAAAVERTAELIRHFLEVT